MNLTNYCQPRFLTQRIRENYPDWRPFTLWQQNAIWRIKRGRPLLRDTEVRRLHPVALESTADHRMTSSQHGSWRTYCFPACGDGQQISPFADAESKDGQFLCLFLSLIPYQMRRHD